MFDIWKLASAVARFLLYLGALGSVGLVLARIVFGRETGGMHGAMVRRATALAAAPGFALGVQWHAEHDPQTNPVNRALFRTF